MQKKRVLSLVLSMIVCIAMMPMAVFADGETYCYIDAEGKTVTVEKSKVKEVTGSDDDVTWSAGWYIVTGDVEFDDCITISGNVNLILTDGHTLNVDKGISGTGADLTIYAGNITGSAVEETGKLVVKGEDKIEVSGECQGGTGIDLSRGNLTINGGILEATGGKCSGEEYIFGGIAIYVGKIFKMNRGKVTAAGGDSNCGSNIQSQGGIGILAEQLEIKGGNIEAIGGNATATAGNLQEYDMFEAAGGEGIEVGANGCIIEKGKIETTGGNVKATVGDVMGNSSFLASGGEGFKLDDKIEVRGGEIVAAGGKVEVANGEVGVGKYDFSKYGGSGIMLSKMPEITGGVITAVGKVDRDAIIGVLYSTNRETGEIIHRSINGNAVIIVNYISYPDELEKGIQQGIAFIGDSGKVYGKPTVSDDAAIPADKTLTIDAGKSLSIAEEKTLTNDGTIIIEKGGSLKNSGTIINNGTIIDKNEAGSNDGIRNNGVIVDNGTLNGEVTNTGIKILNITAIDFGKAAKGYSSVTAQVLLEKGSAEYKAELENASDSDFELKDTAADSQLSPKTGLDAGRYEETVKIKITKAGAKVTTINCNVKFEVTAASSGSSYNPVQKPEIITGEGGKTSLENNGSTLVITPDDGMQISKITVNGNEVTVTDNKVTGLKTGDKVEVTFTKIPPTKEEIDKIFKEKLLNLGLTVRTSKTAKKNVKAVVKETAELKDLIKEIKAAGYTVKYRFYRSTKKSSKYEDRLTKTEGKYINTIGKKGVKYYYRVKLLIYDDEENFIAQTKLKQCKYGFRTWNK